MIFSSFFKRGGGQYFKLILLKGIRTRKVILGLMVLTGLVFAEELTQEQMRDFDRQCKNGNMTICTGLGEIYRSGMGGVSQDYQKAKIYFEKVCKKGNEQEKAYPEACGNLGLMYDEGLGVQQDNKKALKFYTLACNKEKLKHA